MMINCFFIVKKLTMIHAHCTLVMMRLFGYDVICPFYFLRMKREVMPMVENDYILFAIEVLLIASFLKILINKKK